MLVAVIGAGFAGIATARHLTLFGHQVVVFEKCPDVGGVWSRTRRYPNLTTQNTKETYCFSDMPLPDGYPTFPSSEQIQKYLEAYIDKHDLRRLIRFEMEVVAINYLSKDDTKWWLEAQDVDGKLHPEIFDHVVVCNGVFSEPLVPNFDGEADFKQAGGLIIHSSSATDENLARDKHVIVVGYGKSACDAANALESTATTTTLVAPRLLWKLPRKIYGLGYQYLLLTRVGESLFEYVRPSRAERFFASGFWGWKIRDALFNSLQFLITRQLKLKQLDMLPPGKFEDIANSTISLSTDPLYEKVSDGRIHIKRDTSIKSLSVVADQPSVTLSDGHTQPCDVLVCATGFRQRAPFLHDLNQRITDSAGNFILYRHILPIGIPSLTFNGYNSSLFCPLSAEAAALWICAYLKDKIPLPSEEEQMLAAEAEVEFLERRSNGKHAHGTNLVPFSMRSIDETLDDLDLKIGWFAWIKQWLLPIRPEAYQGMAEELRRRIRG